MNFKKLDTNRVLRSFGLQPRRSSLRVAGEVAGLLSLGAAIGAATTWALRNAQVDAAVRKFFKRTEAKPHTAERPTATAATPTPTRRPEPVVTA
ncbi:MAG: hypothetical protein IAE78_32150 [Myxococcus sp.]|nr:hypothetical protein [Myxococcus sp.]